MRAKKLNLYMYFHEVFFFEFLNCFQSNWKLELLVEGHTKSEEKISRNARQKFEFVNVFLRSFFLNFWISSNETESLILPFEERTKFESEQVFLRRVFFFFNFFQSDGKLHDVIWRTYKVWRKNIEKCAQNIWICTSVSTKLFFLNFWPSSN